MSWWSVLILYFAVGCLFIVAGPVARLRRHEVQRIQEEEPAEAERKTRLVSTSTNAIALLLWPIVVPFVWRSTREWDGTRSRDGRTPRAVRRRLKKLLEADIHELTFPEFRALRTGLKWNHVDAFIKGLDDLNITVSGSEANEKGQVRMTAKVADDLFQPVYLTERADEEAIFRAFRVGDEIWRFTTSGESWKNLCGRAGYALVRDGTVVETHVTIMN